MLKDYEKQDNLTSQKTKDRMTQGKGHVPQHRDKTRGRNTQTQAKINWRKFSETPLSSMKSGTGDVSWEVGTGDVSWEVECLLSKHETLGSVLEDPKPGMVILVLRR